MIFFRKNKKDQVSLLPHTRTEVYGLDPSSAQMIGWEIKKLNIDRQWTYSEGRGVIVAVIDTGCDLEHIDIKNNLLKGINIIDKSKDPQDDNGHGSHVCGMIAAENNGLGMVGVSPKVKILPVKALDSKGNGSLRNVIEGIIWAADAGADFITMSLGASNSNDQLEKILSYFDIAQKEGAKCLIGGKRHHQNSGLDKGYYIEPTILEGHNKMRVFHEEIFGPVVAVTKFKNYEDAIEIANDTLYGLGAGVWTRNGNVAYSAGRDIQAGRVWTNCYHLYPAHATFGGYKQSGIGRENHKMMLNHYQQVKNLLVSYTEKPLGFF